MAKQQSESDRSRKDRRAAARAATPREKRAGDASIRADIRKAIERRATGFEKALKAVGQLSNADAGPNHFEDFQHEAGLERADRGAAILLPQMSKTL
jgi:hypothetical protein